MWNTIIVQPFLNLILWIYHLVGNFGVAIILFTLLTKLVLYPLTASQLKSTKAMQDLQKDPRYLAMMEKYKDNKEQLAQEQMKLYKEMKINPLSSCLPTLIQFPIIIGLYQALIQTLGSGPLDLLNLTRQVYPKFLDLATLLPLNSKFWWMDMGLPERLFIPGINFGIPTLAIVVVITTYLSTKLMTPPPQPGASNQGAMMSNMMNIYMPILMGWMAWSLSSGLALYFVVTNFTQILQYAISGNLHWDNLKFWKKKDAVKPTDGKKPVLRSSMNQVVDARKSDYKSPTMAGSDKKSKSTKGSSTKKTEPRK